MKKKKDIPTHLEINTHPVQNNVMNIASVKLYIWAWIKLK